MDSADASKGSRSSTTRSAWLPGAKRIASTTTGNLDDVAFQNPNGSLVLIVDNSSGPAQSFSTSWGSQQFSDSLPSHGIATYQWTPSGA